MKRKLGWFGLGFAGAELAAAILPPLVCVPAAAFLVCLALLWIKRRRDSAIPVLGALCGLAWFLAFTLVWVRPVKALAGQTVTCTAVVETDADASYSESRLRGTLRLTEIDGRAANVKVQCASFPGESAGERFTAKFALTELPDNKYRLSRQSKGVYLQAEYLGSYHPLDASRAPRFALYRLRQRWSATLRRWLPRQPAAQCGRPALPKPIQRKPRRAAGVQWVVAAQILRLQIDTLALAAQAVFVVGQLGQRKFCSEPLPRTLAGKGRALHLYVGRPAVNFSQPQRTAQAAFAVGSIGVRLHHRRAGHGLPGQCLDGPHPYKGKRQKPR